MAFDLNCWHDKAYHTDDNALKQKYFGLYNLTKKKFLEEHNMFKDKYIDSRRKCSVNEEYLQKIYPSLLTGEVYIPPTLLNYIINKFNLDSKILRDLRELYYQKGWTRSVGGLRIIHHQYSNPFNSEQLLMFEVWEFTLTYPEYGDLFVEEWV